MLSLGQAFFSLRDGLRRLYDEGEAAAIAHEALYHISGLSRLERLSRKDVCFTEIQEDAYNRIKAALLKGVPLQYATGRAFFMGRSFIVTDAVLIPRPETEELIRWMLEEEQPGSILDIGTGSGCIAVSLKLGLPEANVRAIDVHHETLAIARENAGDSGAEIHFETLDFLDDTARDTLAVFDMIVSNPPYIPITERDTLHVNVRDHEPPAALFVPADDALLFYRVIAGFGLTHLTEGGSIYCELHQHYAGDTEMLFKEYGYNDVTLRRDIHGALRMLRARR